MGDRWDQDSRSWVCRECGRCVTAEPCPCQDLYQRGREDATREWQDVARELAEALRPIVEYQRQWGMVDSPDRVEQAQALARYDAMTVDEGDQP